MNNMILELTSIAPRAQVAARRVDSTLCGAGRPTIHMKNSFDTDVSSAPVVLVDLEQHTRHLF